MQTIIISGNIGSDAVTRSTSNNEVTSFNVGVRQGFGDKQSTNWYRCNIWGERGRKIAEYLLKGAKVFVTGELTIGEYQGKPQYEVRVNEVEWERRHGGEPRQQTGNGGGGYRAPADGDLDDDVPFATCDPNREGFANRKRVI